jgi:valyl-tRNA synthetase
MSDLESRTRYDPSEVEPRIVERWLASGIFHPDATPPSDGETTFSVAIPPPNVTGVLHMGHALNNSLQDCLVRHARMQGRRTKWILGTDHAGIATQTQVEKALVNEGTDREALGRDRFISRVWEWREKYGGEIVEQLKRLGASADYEEERFTLDPQYAQAVQRVFVELFNKGYIYRDRYLVNWDPGSRSAISDLEVEDREVTDTLFYVDYPLASGSGAITVATVRPETMLADTAVAVNPNDDRYKRLIGETVNLPLTNRKLKIIADEYVKPDFGTGALKITPGHDPNDFEIGHRHHLEQLSVIGEDGRMTEEAGEYAGLTTSEAQARIVDDLRNKDLIARTEPYHHTVPFSHRSGERIEPLVSLQWFMRMDELAAPAIQAVKDKSVRFHPERWTKVYLDWMENIRPWCVSRQLWWGHQIPVWYRGDDTYVGTEPPPNPDQWERDPDVLDTWFSSALWPFATLGWPDQTQQLETFYPTNVLSTGRDIIFLWVARMIMMGIEFAGGIPFSDVCIHSIIQAPDGRRMSKSLGTGIDPTDLIGGGPRPPVFGDDPGDFPAYGADAVRWGLMAMSSGQDVRFSEEKLDQGLKLTNKLWNASRLILLSVGPEASAPSAPAPKDPADRWITSRVRHAKQEIDDRIARFDFAHAALGLYDFIYGELCDWYLELVKPRLHAKDPEAIATLMHVLTETLSLAHPLIPFVTEEIWSHVPGAEGLLAARTTTITGPRDEQAEVEIANLIEAIQAVRAWRTASQVKPGAPLNATLAADGYAHTLPDLTHLARLELTDTGDPVAAIPIPGGTIEILPSAGFDPQAADERTAAERKRIQAEIDRAKAKLGNKGFVAKAPPAVVAQEREKLARLQAELDAL